MKNDVYFVLGLRIEDQCQSRYLFDFDSYVVDNSLSSSLTKLQIWKHSLTKQVRSAHYFREMTDRVKEHLEFVQAANLSVNKTHFDLAYYLEHNPDVNLMYLNKKSASEVWQHFLSTGSFEIRKFRFTNNVSLTKSTLEAKIKKTLNFTRTTRSSDGSDTISNSNGSSKQPPLKAIKPTFGPKRYISIPQTTPMRTSVPSLVRTSVPASMRTSAPTYMRTSAPTSTKHMQRPMTDRYIPITFDRRSTNNHSVNRSQSNHMNRSQSSDHATNNHMNRSKSNDHATNNHMNRTRSSDHTTNNRSADSSNDATRGSSQSTANTSDTSNSSTPTDSVATTANTFVSTDSLSSSSLSSSDKSGLSSSDKIGLSSSDKSGSSSSSSSSSQVDSFATQQLVNDLVKKMATADKMTLKLNETIQEMQNNMCCEIEKVLKDRDLINTSAVTLNLEAHLEKKLNQRLDMLACKVFQNNSGICYLHLGGLNLRGVPLNYHQISDRIFITGSFAYDNIIVHCLNEQLEIKFVSGEDFEPVRKSIVGHIYLHDILTENVYYGSIGPDNLAIKYRLGKSAEKFKGPGILFFHMEYRIDQL